MKEQFLRSEMMLGTKALETLAQSHVAVFGIGGVGSCCVEALARAGVGQLTLIDQDIIGESNINRQIEALHSTLGEGKADAMAKRVLDINPDCMVTPILGRYTPETAEDFHLASFDYIVDAIDTVSAKLDLIERSLGKNTPIISAMGTGNKLDASLFRVSDISKTTDCALSRIMRKELKNRGIKHHKVVFSPELPQKTEQKETPPPGRRSVPASVPWVPPVAGLLLAGAVVEDLIRKKD